MNRPTDLTRWGLNNWGDGQPVNEATVLEVVDIATQYFEKTDKEEIFNSSYGLKHLVERFLESYVSNGELIAGMVAAGFYIYRVSDKSPNCYFNLDPKSVFQFKKEFGL